MPILISVGPQQQTGENTTFMTFTANLREHNFAFAFMYRAIAVIETIERMR